MNNELIVIEQATAVAVLSTDDGIKTLLENVRANIDNMDGGSMKNKSSRAKIRSNAFKATKAYTKINGETIEPLIASLTAKIQPQLNVINAIKENQSVLKSGLQQIRKDVNEDVDAFEAELQRIEDEKFEADRVALVERDREFAMMMYSEYLSQVALGESILVDWKKAADEKIETDRIAREKQIADDAAETARLKAENDAAAEKKQLEDEKQEALDLAETNKQLAIQAELDAEESEKQRVIAEENAKELAIQQEKQRVIDAEAAETKRLADVEQGRIDTENRIEAGRLAKEKQASDLAIQNEKNVAKFKEVMGETKRSIIELGVPEEFAILVTKGLHSGSIANVGKIQF